MRHVSGIVPPINSLGFEACPYALTFGIVVAASTVGVHALDDAEALQAGPEIIAGILASSVGTEDGATYTMEAVGRRKALRHQGCLHVVVHGQAQAEVIEAVKHGRDVEVAVGCW